jgi:integrase
MVGAGLPAAVVPPHSRRWHEGSVTTLPSGRYRAFRARAPDGKRPSRTFVSRELAEAWARGEPEPDVLYLGAWLERWLALRLPTVSAQTKRNYRAFVLACSDIAHVPLAEVTTEHLQAHTNALLGRWSRSHVNAWRAIISAVFKAAVPRLIPHNPMIGVRLPKAVERPVKAWRADEVATLLDAARGRAHETWLWLSLGTGIRIGESRALTWAHVDLSGRTITVAASRDQTSDQIGPTKSRRTRVVDLPDELVPVLVAHRARQRPSERYVCTSAYSGRIPDPKSVQAWLRRLCADIGVTPHSPHATRHTYATLALEAGVPLKEVSEALGHSNVAITANTYAHVLSERRRRAATAIGAILAPKPSGLHEIGSARTS